MKLIKVLIGCALAGVLAAPVHAQLGNPGRIVASNIGTGVVSTNNAGMTSAGLPLGGAGQLNCLPLGAGATNTVTVQVQKTVDGVYWQNDLVMTLTCAGATGASCISNISASAIAFWRVSTVTSTPNGVGTNANVEVWFSKAQSQYR